MGRTYLLMAFVFVAAGAAIWYFQFGAGRADQTSARSLTAEQAWPIALGVVKPFIRNTTQSLREAGVPPVIAPLLVIGMVLLGGYLIAYFVLKIVNVLFSNATFIAGLFQIVVAPLWQVGLTLISALQTVEWFQDKGFIPETITTPAYIVFAIISLTMMYGLSKVSSRAMA